MPQNQKIAAQLFFEGGNLLADYVFIFLQVLRAKLNLLQHGHLSVLHSH
jgi:hypothetical protein